MGGTSKNINPGKKRKRRAKFKRKVRVGPSPMVTVPRFFRRSIFSGSTLTYHSYKLKSSLPAAFSFAEDKESVLGFLNDTFSLYKRSKRKTKDRAFVFDLKSVENIDITSICLFLSLINKLKQNGIGSRGNFPDNENARTTIIESGFSEMMQSEFKQLKTKKYTNQIYIVGSKRVNNKRLGQSVKEAVGYLTGEEQHFKPMYTMLIEMCSNSVEHANRNEQDKNWVVSVSYEEDCVRFIVVDTGEGILRTIHKKWPERFMDSVYRNDGDVLSDILDKGYQSRTKEINRHKGLPRIKECHDAGFVSDMMILTNNVILY